MGRNVLSYECVSHTTEADRVIHNIENLLIFVDYPPRKLLTIANRSKMLSSAGLVQLQ